MKVLFLGNSHTYFHDMPALFARFVRMSTGREVEVVMLAYSERNLAWHLAEYFPLRFNLMYGGYDYCVIQQAAHPYPPVETTMRDTAAIIDMCRRCSVTPIVFMTWAEKRFPEHQQIMIDTCAAVAQENQALLAPIGKIWQDVLQRGDIELFYSDGEHAGTYGDFLIAACLCGLLTGKLPEEISGLGFNFLDPDPLDFEAPHAQEEKAQIPCPLDKEKCGFILSVIRRELGLIS